jgi:tRNA threonylcarbamoyladenosine biosynthesis protein TsaB
MSRLPAVALDTVLALDTGGSFCSVALRTTDGVVVYEESEGQGDHFERLPGIVRRVCTKSGIATSDLKQIRIGVGPGSFTGLRIGMSFAKGLAMTHRIPLVGVSSFLAVAYALAQRGSLKAGSVAVISDARRDEVFMASYAVLGGSVVEQSPPSIVSVHELAAWQAAEAGRQVCCSLRDFAPAGVCDVRVESRIAEGLLAVEGVDQGPFSLEQVSLLEPTYLRAVAAKSIEERRGA